MKRLLGLLVAFLVIVGLAGCTTTVAPEIRSFDASPTSIDSGQSATLNWSVSGTSTVTLSINNGVGDVTGKASVTVSPTQTTTYVLTATNAAGMTSSSATVTVNAPASRPSIASFSASPPSIQAGGSATLAWSVSGSGSITLSIDNGVGNVTNSTSTVVSPPQTTTYTLTATNAQGSSTAKTTVTVGGGSGSATAPVVSISSPADNNTVSSSSATVSGSVSVDSSASLSSVSYAVNGGSGQACSVTSSTFSCPVSGLVSGANVVTVTATDSNNQTGTATLHLTYQVPGAPVVVISSPNAGTTVSSPSVNVTGTVQPASGVTITKVAYALNGGASQSCTLSSATTPPSFTCSVGGLASGNNTILVTATDSNGKSGSATLGVTYSTAATAPVVSISSPADNSSVSSSSVTASGSVKLDSSASLSSVVYRLNGGSSTSCTVSGTNFTCSVGNLALGSNTIAVTATDSNSKTGSATVHVDYQKNVPLSVTISSPADNSTVTSTSVTVSGSVTVPSSASLSSVAYQLNGGSSTSCTVSGTNFTCSVGNLAQGSNTIAVTATDSSNVTATGTVHVDFAPGSLSVTITKPTNDSTVSSPSVTVSGSVSGLAQSASLSSVVYQLNGGSSTSCTVSGTNFTCSVGNLAQGKKNTIAVNATASNTAKGTSSVSVTFSSPPPSVSITSPANNSSVTTNSVTVSGSVKLASGATLSSVTYKLNSGASQSCTVSSASFDCSVSSLAKNANTVAVTATDSYGKTGTASVQVSYSPPPPKPSITSPANNSSVSTNSVTVSGSVSLASGATLSSASYTLNGGGAQTCTVSGSTFDCKVSSLAPGSNAIVVTVVDSNGKSGTASISVTYNPSKPVVSISSSTKTSVTTPSVTVAGTVKVAPGSSLVQVTYALNGGAAQACVLSAPSFTCSVSGLRPNGNSIVVTAHDSNSATGSATWQVSYTPPPPIPTITSPSDNGTVQVSSVTVSGSVQVASGLSLSVVTYSLNSGSARTCSITGTNFNCSVTGLAQSTNTIQVVATDSTNSSGYATVHVTWSPPPPIPTITSPSDNGTVTSSSVTVTGNVQIASGASITSVVYSLNGGSSRSCGASTSFSCSVSGLAAGSNTITVTATDSNGKSGSGSVSVSYSPPPQAPTSVVNFAVTSPYAPQPGAGYMASCYTELGVATNGTSTTVGPSSSTYRWGCVTFKASPTSNVTSYTIVRTTSSTGTVAVATVNAGGRLEYVDTSASSATPYEYGVYATNVNGQRSTTAWSNYDTIPATNTLNLTLTKNNCLNVPGTFGDETNLSYKCGTSARQVKFTWSDPWPSGVYRIPDLVRYQIAYSYLNVFTGISSVGFAGQPSGYWWTFNGNTPNVSYATYYHWRVFAMETAEHAFGQPQAGIVLGEVVRFTVNNTIDTLTAPGAWGGAYLPMSVLSSYYTH